MRLISLRIVNCFQHKLLHVDLMPGITGVLGLNGSGKSNFLELLYFSFTGKLYKHNKDTSVNWDAEQGYTILTFEDVDGNICVLTRNMHNSGVTLVVGKDTLGSSTLANAWMRDAIGMDPKAILETCWVPQRALTDIIAAPHSVRMALLQRIVGIGEADKIRGQLQDAISRVPVLEDYTAPIVTVQAAIVEHESEEAQCLTKTAGLEWMLPGFTRAKGAAQEQLRKLGRTQFEERRNRLWAEYHVKQAEFDASADQAPAPVIEILEPSDEDKLLQDASTRLPRLLDRLKVAEERLEDLEVAEDRTYTAAIPDTRAADADAIAAGLVEQLAAGKHKNILSQTGECPTCGTKHPALASNDPDAAAIIAAELQAYSLTRQQCKEAIALASRLRADQAQADNTAAIASQEATGAREALGLLRSSTEELQAQVGTFNNEAHADLLEGARAYAIYVQKQRNFEASRGPAEAAAIAHRAAFDNWDATEFVEDQVHIDAQRTIDIAAKLDTDIAACAAVLPGCQRALAEKRASLERMFDVEKLREKYEKLRRLLTVSREVLHRDNLPRAVMSRLLVGINIRVADYMRLFNTNFSAYMNDEFDFMCVFGEQERLAADTLSVGQMVVLGLAARFALADILGPNLQIIALDEPTDALDSINRPLLVAALKRAREVSERGSYILVSTHDEALTPAMSQTLNLSEDINE